MRPLRPFALPLTGFLISAQLFGATPTVQDAKKFLDDAEKKLFDVSLEASQAS